MATFVQFPEAHFVTNNRFGWYKNNYRFFIIYQLSRLVKLVNYNENSKGSKLQLSMSKSMFFRQRL